MVDDLRWPPLATELGPGHKSLDLLQGYLNRNTTMFSPLGLWVVDDWTVSPRSVPCSSLLGLGFQLYHCSPYGLVEVGRVWTK